MDRTLRFWIFVTLIVMFSLNVNAADISGRIIDTSNGQPIENANVKVEMDGSEYGTTTSSDGGFLFNTPDRRGNIIITHVGYQPFFQNVALSGDVDLGTIRLQPKLYTVGEVTVVANFQRLTCEDLFFRPDAINDPNDYHYYTSETSRCANRGVCFNYFSCKKVDTFEGECEFLDERNSDVGFCVSHACGSDYLDCDGDSFGNDKNGCECRIDQGIDTYGCANRQCTKISEEGLPAPGFGFGGQQPPATGPTAGVTRDEEYFSSEQNGLCPQITCPDGFQCRAIDGKCIKPENYDKQRCRIVTDYDNVQDGEGVSSNPIKGVEFWRKDIYHTVAFEDKFYGNECIENENENGLSAADVANRAREAYRNRESLRREAREKLGISSMSIFEFLDGEDEHGVINALLENSQESGIEVEVLTAAAFQEGLSRYVAQFSPDVHFPIPSFFVGLHYTFENSASIDTLKNEGFLRNDFDEYFARNEGYVDFTNINSAIEALSATLLHRRSLFFEDLEELGIDKNTLTKDQVAYWTYLYFNCGDTCGRNRIGRYGIEIPKWIGSSSVSNTNRNTKLFLGIVYQIRSAGLFDSLNQVKVYYCENDELKFTVVDDKENLCSILKRDTELIDIDLEDIPELDLVDLVKPELQRYQEIIITMSGNELVKNAICSSLPSGLEFVEESTITEPTASVIKQITGFFSKITGRQVLTQADKKYTAKIITTAYYDLANSPNPYLRIGFYSDDSVTRIDRTVQARFLEKKLGSALLRSFGYTKDKLEPAITSAEVQNEMATNRESGQYKHSIGIINRENQPSKLKILDTQRGFDIEISDSEYEALDIAIPDYKDFIKFLLVSTEEDRYFDINGNVYSVSAGTYLVPYPWDYNYYYTQLATPEEDYKLKPYYEIAKKKKEITYNVVDNKVLTVPLLTPSESYFLLRNIPEDFENIRKSYRYKGNNVNYRIIALKEDYGDFKKGVYLAPEDYVISMDNLYSLNKKTVIRFLPAQPGSEIIYNDKFFDSLRRYIRDSREPTFIDWLANLEKTVSDTIRLDPTRRSYP